MQLPIHCLPQNNVVLSEYSQMDRLLKAEKKLILGMCKKIKKAGCNVLLMQKSILRDATTALSRHYLSKMKIMVVTDVERSDIEFITRVRSRHALSYCVSHVWKERHA